MKCRYFVSFDPRFPLEENCSPFADLEDRNLLALLEGALGVVLPVYLTPARYEAITRHAKDWFPDLRSRFIYRGKCSQIELFRHSGVRHPESLLFDSPSAMMEAFESGQLGWNYPFVMKGDSGGGGISVFPVHDSGDLERCCEKLKRNEPALVQRWVHHGGRDLRVVVYGDRAHSYFRVGDGSFYNNVCRGGRLDHHSHGELQERGRRSVLELCRKASIHVAGFDLMFPDEGAPVFVEINFHFGRKGLGGTPEHRRHMGEAIERWCSAKVKEKTEIIPCGMF